MLSEPDYQAYPYSFCCEVGYRQDMSGAIRSAARAVLTEYPGQATRLLEIGVWEGRSGCWLIDNVLVHPDSRYIGIDNWTSPPGVRRTATDNLAFHGPKATLLEGDSRQVVLSLTGVFDVVVIDGGHTYEVCLADLQNCWPKLTVRGIMIVDDYTYPGLPGVPRAVNEFLSERVGQYEILHREVAIALRKLC